MPRAAEDNPFASPKGLDEVEIEAQVVPDSPNSEPQAKREPPPNSIMLAWMLGLVLCPVKFICFGVLGVFLIIPLIGVLAYLPTRERWVWTVAIVFFLAEAFLFGVAGLGMLGMGMLPLAAILLISVLLCLIIVVCLCKRSAREHYHRNEV